MLLITKIFLSVVLTISALYQSFVVICFLCKIVINTKLKMLSNNSSNCLLKRNGETGLGVKMLFTIMSVTCLGKMDFLKYCF